jgi:hypothetical protein
LATIDAHSDSGVITLGASGTGNALSQAGLVVKGALGGTTAYLSGAGDVVTTTSATTATISATGAGTSITLASNTHGSADASNLTGIQTVYASGAGDTIDVSNLGTGTGNDAVIINGASNGAAVGANAIVKLGVGISSYVDTVYAGSNTNVFIGGGYDVVNVSNTAAAYGTTGNTTTIQLGSHLGTAVTSYASTDSVVFGGTNTTWTTLGVNVGSATTLSAALTIAAKAAEAAITTVDGTHDSIDWFQFGGNTYIYQAAGVGASGTHSTTGVDVTDTVVKIVGLVDLHAANATISSHSVLL